MKIGQGYSLSLITDTCSNIVTNENMVNSIQRTENYARLVPYIPIKQDKNNNFNY